MNDEMNDEIRKMIDMENSILNITKMMAKVYTGLIESGLPENVALELTVFWLDKMFDQIGGGNNVNK